VTDEIQGPVCAFPSPEGVRVAAGGSALREAERSRLVAAHYRHQLQIELARAKTFGIAGRTEAKVGAALAAMQDWGWHLLADRRWTPTSSANIDLIHVGPGGVLVIDVKSWAEPAIVDGRLYRGQADAGDDVDNLRRIAELVTDATSELGLAPTEVVPVMVFVNQRRTNTQLGRIRILDEHSLVPWAVARGHRLADDQIKDLTRLLDDRFPPCDARPAAVSLPLVIAEPVLPIARPAHPEAETLFDAQALEAAVLHEAMLAPIESWMTFLHPEQVRLIRRVSTGASRIRGAAGTGKTVVALHRAAYLAEASWRPVLVTSFIKTLPPTLAGLYSQLSPGTCDRVEFTSLHRWASQLLTGRGHRLRIDTRLAELAYTRAWSRHGRASGLGAIGVDWKYWRDEISHVIKGRGITEFAEYAALRRIGRRTRLSVSQREIVWAMYVDYESQLREAGVIDFNDQISLALAEVRRRPLDRDYAAVIVDEVQDLSCQALRLLARISGDGERLLVVGDGQQQIYPGGYTLAEAGISVAGRSTVLRTNYRNAANILAASAQLVIDDDYNDLDDEYEHGHRDVVAVRDDGQVWAVTLASVEALRTSAVTHIRNLLAAGHSIAGIALLCSSNDAVKTYLGLLAAADIAATNLADYVGRPVDAVKVGTYQRAKGLEFKDVVLPVHTRASTARSEDGQQEARELENRALFVGMTRARDTLWVGRLRAGADAGQLASPAS
jgi:hypothetical protein